MSDIAASDVGVDAEPPPDDEPPSREDLEREIAALTEELSYIKKKLADEISRREMTQRALEGLSRHDPLTMLPNRGLFEETVRHALERDKSQNRELAVLALNLDQFTMINDSLGHTIGDLLLREVAQRVHSCLRNGHVAGRLGGDEFFILADPVDGSDDAADIGQGMISAVNEPYMLAGHPCTIGISIGISMWPDHGEDAETLMQNAHRAMLRAKKAGRNTVKVYTDD